MARKKEAFEVQAKLNGGSFNAEAARLRGNAEKSATANGKLTGSFNAIGAAAGVAAVGIGAVIAVGAKAITAAEGQIEAQTKLAAAIRGSGQAIDAERIEAYASELQTLTTFGDEATIQMAALLTSFELNEDQIISLMPRVQNLAALWGISLDAAAQKVGKTLATGTNTLERQGVVMDAHEKKLFRSANETERLAILTKKLDETTGDAAESLRKATGGLKATENAIGDLWEELGFFIQQDANEYFDKLATAIGGFTEKVKMAREEAVPLFERLRLETQLSRLRTKRESLEERLEDFLGDPTKKDKADAWIAALGLNKQTIAKVEAQLGQLTSGLVDRTLSRLGIDGDGKPEMDKGKDKDPPKQPKLVRDGELGIEYNPKNAAEVEFVRSMRFQNRAVRIQERLDQKLKESHERQVAGVLGGPTPEAEGATVQVQFDAERAAREAAAAAAVAAEQEKVDAIIAELQREERYRLTVLADNGVSQQDRLLADLALFETSEKAKTFILERELQAREAELQGWSDFSAKVTMESLGFVESMSTQLFSNYLDAVETAAAGQQVAFDRMVVDFIKSVGVQIVGIGTKWFFEGAGNVAMGLIPGQQGNIPGGLAMMGVGAGAIAIGGGMATTGAIASGQLTASSGGGGGASGFNSLGRRPDPGSAEEAAVRTSRRGSFSRGGTRETAVVQNITNFNAPVWDVNNAARASKKIQQRQHDLLIAG